jgi:hypothetical protein
MVDILSGSRALCEGSYSGGGVMAKTTSPMGDVLVWAIIRQFLVLEDYILPVFERIFASMKGWQMTSNVSDAISHVVVKGCQMVRHVSTCRTVEQRVIERILADIRPLG